MKKRPRRPRRPRRPPKPWWGRRRTEPAAPAATALANASVVLQMVPGPQAVSRLPLSVYHSPRSAAEPVEPTEPTEPAEAEPRSVETADSGTGPGVLFPFPEFMPEEMPTLNRRQTRRLRAELRRFLGAERLPAGLSDEDAYRQYRGFRRRL